MKTLGARAARGETISLSFELESDYDVAKVRVSCATFGNEIGASAAIEGDVYIAHTWKQAGIGVYQADAVDVKELLLKDDSAGLNDGYERRFRNWRHIFKPHHEYRPPDLRLTGEAHTSLRRGERKSFLLLIRTENTATRGRYQSHIQINYGGDNNIMLPVDLEILPFALDEAAQDIFLWYHGKLDWRDAKNYLSEDAFRKQLQAIRDHGFTSISLSEIDREHAQRALEIVEEVGFTGNVVLLPPFPANPHTLNYSRIKLLVYLSDEIDVHIAHPDACKSDANKLIEYHKINWQRARQWGLNSFCSLVHESFAHRFFNTDDIGYAPDTLSYYLAHNRDYMHISTHIPARRKPTYYYWQCFQEKPNLNRVLAGIYLWKTKATGVAPYCFQNMPVYPFSPYNDFDEWIPDFHVGQIRRPFKDHMTTYPARSGIIPTLQWEGLRDGITDLRYLTTLDNRLNRAASRGDEHLLKQCKEIIDEREKLLMRIDVRSIKINDEREPEPFGTIPPNEYSEFRSKFADWILSLDQAI
jgi:hypothetical protein